MATAPPNAGRILTRDGRITIARSGLRTGYFGDLYHLLLVSSWLRLLLLFVGAYMLANAVFAVLYILGGDCIEGARPGSLSDAFFFSVQTMATIGYGKMVPRTFWSNTLV